MAKRLSGATDLRSWALLARRMRIFTFTRDKVLIEIAVAALGAAVRRHPGIRTVQSVVSDCDARVDDRFADHHNERPYYIIHTGGGGAGSSLPGLG